MARLSMVELRHLINSALRHLDAQWPAANGEATEGVPPQLVRMAMEDLRGASAMVAGTRATTAPKERKSSGKKGATVPADPISDATGQGRA